MEFAARVACISPTVGAVVIEAYAPLHKNCPTGETVGQGWDYFPGLKLSFRLTERLNTRRPGAQSLLSGQK